MRIGEKRRTGRNVIGVSPEFSMEVLETERMLNNETHCEGLCMNCCHRGTCTLPKCEGRIYCEEYECG